MTSAKKQFLFIFLVVDLLILFSSYLLIIHYHDLNFLSIEYLISYLVGSVLFWIISFKIFSKNFYFHKNRFLGQFQRISKKTLLFSLFSFVFLNLFFPKNFQFIFIKQALLFYISSVGLYYLFFKYLKFKREAGINVQRTAIISKCKTGILLQQIIECNPILGFKFVGFIDKDNHSAESGILGTLTNLDEIIKKLHLQIIFSVQSDLENELENFLISICDKNGVRLRLVSRNDQLCGMLMNARASDGVKIKIIHKIPLDDKRNRLLKRIFDFIFSLFVIVTILSWLLPIIAFLIKMDSKGPVFFNQKRTGFGNRTFTCLKFRTMVINELSDIQQATLNDKRITRIGKFLRRYNLDELPQFFNVLRGEMSVVGPRPHMLKHTEQYSELITNYLIRHYVKPGITGWAQINGYHGETHELWKMQKRVAFDWKYMQNWNFISDLKIILYTLTGYKVKTKKDFFVSDEVKLDEIKLFTLD